MIERGVRSGDSPPKKKRSLPRNTKLGAGERRVKYRSGTKPGPDLGPNRIIPGGLTVR